MTDGAKKKDENGKNPEWQVPMTMDGVRPGDYNISPGSGPADPAGDNVQQVTQAHRKLAGQQGSSG